MIETITPDLIAIVHQITDTPRQPLTEGNSPKYNSFSKWKEAASEWASHNTQSSEPELETEMVGTGDSDARACPRWWHQFYDQGVDYVS